MISLTKLAALNLALYVLISLNPYIRWMLPNEIFYGLFIFTFSLITLVLGLKVKGALVINLNRKLILIMLLVFVVYFTVPIVHELRIGHLVWFIPFFMLVFYNEGILFQSYKYVKFIIVVVCSFSLLYWVLNLLSVSIPYYSYIPEFRHNPNDYYRIYGPTISLYRGSFAIGEFYGLERITGIFAEPGHFGIYLGIILAIEKFQFKKIETRILLVTGILTFSTAFFGIIALGILYRLVMDEKFSSRVVLISSIFITTLILFLILGDTFEKITYGRVLNSVNDRAVTNIIDSRVSDTFINNFNTFINQPAFYTGLGYSLDENFATTNWRGLIFRFGLFGLIIMLGLIYTISINANRNLYGIIIALIAIIILMHRSYLLYPPSIYLLMYFSTLKIDELRE